MSYRDVEDALKELDRLDPHLDNEAVLRNITRAIRLLSESIQAELNGIQDQLRRLGSRSRG